MKYKGEKTQKLISTFRDENKISIVIGVFLILTNTINHTYEMMINSRVNSKAMLLYNYINFARDDPLFEYSKHIIIQNIV